MNKAVWLRSVNVILNIAFGLVLISAVFRFFSTFGQTEATEFYISYVSGLIKRGVAGNVLYYISKMSGLDGGFVVNGFVSVMLVLNIFVIIILFIKKKLDLFILLSSFLILNIYGYHIAYRLDLLLIPLCIVQMFILHSKKANVCSKLICTSLLLCLGVSIHEVYFLLMVFTLLYIIWETLGYRKVVPVVLSFLPSLVLFILFITVFSGNQDQIGYVINSWDNLSVKPEKLEYLNWLYSLKGPVFIWDNAAFIKSKLNYIGFFLNYILACALFYGYINYFFDLKSNNKRVFVFGNFVLILILCIIATDFIRWYYLVFIIILCYFTIFEKKVNKPLSFGYVSLKFSSLFVGLPMYGWTMTHFYWTTPLKYLIDLKNYL